MSKLALELLHGQGEPTLPTMKPEGKGAGAKKERVEIDFSKVKVEPLFEEEVDFDTFSKSDFRVVKIKSCKEMLNLLLVDDRIPAGAKLY